MSYKSTRGADMTNPVTIGDCTLYLGDCREILLTLDNIDAVVTDPPYGMAFQSNYRKIKRDKIANDDDADILRFASTLPIGHSRYMFCRWENLADVPKPKSAITWVKNTAAGTPRAKPTSNPMGKNG